MRIHPDSDTFHVYAALLSGSNGRSRKRVIVPAYGNASLENKRQLASSKGKIVPAYGNVSLKNKRMWRKIICI
jgi:hypothetical protein